jgi:hypothetical protein
MQHGPCQRRIPSGQLHWSAAEIRERVIVSGIKAKATDGDDKGIRKNGVPPVEPL